MPKKKNINNKTDNIKSKKNDIGDKSNDKKLDDTQYYKELYNDLPEEVADILMETHPFMGKNLDSDEAAYRTRKRGISEIDEIRKARNKQINEELKKDLENRQKEDIEDLVIRNPFANKISLKESIEKQSIKNSLRVDKMDKEDNKIDKIGKEDNKMDKMNKKDNKIDEKNNNKNLESEYNLVSENKKDNNDNDENKKDNNNENKKNKIFAFPKKDDDIDYGVLEGKASVNDLYGSEDFDYDEDFIKLPSNKKMLYGIGAVFVCLFLFFAIRTLVLSSKLNKAQEEITQLNDVQEKNEELKMDNLSLQEQLYGKAEEVQQEVVSQEEIPQEVATQEEIPQETATQEEIPQETTTQEEIPQEAVPVEEFDTYTVVDGDTIGSIATKIYGNYAYYVKILEANGITEEHKLQIGQVLKIPKNVN